MALGLSFVGTWAHELALAYLALEIGGSAAALGSLLLSFSIHSIYIVCHFPIVVCSRIVLTSFSQLQSPIIIR